MSPCAAGGRAVLADGRTVDVGLCGLLAVAGRVVTLDPRAVRCELCCTKRNSDPRLVREVQDGARSELGHQHGGGSR